MLRSTLIYLSQATWARQVITTWPFAWRAASRFVSGENLSEAIEAIDGLNKRGIEATIDHLGEHTNTHEKAMRATQDIMQAVEAVDRSHVRAGVSIKLTQIGLALDEELCSQNLKQILDLACEKGSFVRIDMEDSPWVDSTIAVYWRMRDECAFTNVGTVLQAYLYRSEEDVKRILAHGGRIRLCKGAYKEPPEVAFPKKREVDENFDRLAKLMIDGALECGAPAISADGKVPPIPAIASHDERRLEYAKSYARQVGLPRNAIEFQMLYGIRRDLQEQTLNEGYPVRVYVPYGTEWYPYYVRRLAERPANLWFFISNFFRR